MTKQTTTLNSTARSAIVATFCSAMTAAENTGSHVTQVCETAQRFLKGTEVSKDDQDAIIKDIGTARGWKGDTLRARGSEVRVILRAYAQLPEAVESYKAKAKGCTWHNAMKLARLINKHEKVSKAVALALEQKTAAPVSPQGRVAGGLKAWYKQAKGDKRASILQAAALLGLKLGIKLDA